MSLLKSQAFQCFNSKNKSVKVTGTGVDEYITGIPHLATASLNDCSQLQWWLSPILAFITFTGV